MSKNMKRILSVTLKRMFDESPDTSHYGEYGQRAESEYSIDRHHSKDCQSVIPGVQDYADVLKHAADYLEGQYPEDEGLKSSMRDALGIDESIRTLIKTYEDAIECDCSKSYDSREYQFFNPNYQNYKGLPEEEIRKYCWQDYERVEAMNRNEWGYIGIRAEAEIRIPYMTEGRGGRTYYKTEPITSGSLWGIESDSGEDYLEEVEQEELSSLKAELKAIGFSSRAIATAFKDIQRSGDAR